MKFALMPSTELGVPAIAECRRANFFEVEMAAASGQKCLACTYELLINCDAFLMMN